MIIHKIEGIRLTQVIINCHRVLRGKYKSSPLWALVGDVTGHGSQYSREICIQSNLDPDQSCWNKDLKNLIDPKDLV